MSRIGNTPISIPEKVDVTVDGDSVTIKGPKGELQVELFPRIDVTVEEGKVSVSRRGEQKKTKSFHGLVRSLINNHIIGVTEGYKKTLKMVGVGYRVQQQGSTLSLAVGYSDNVEVEAVDGITLSVDGNDTIYIEGIDKQLVGEVAANIRKIKPPEPYKGKGIRYEGEYVIRKQGKKAAGTE